MINKGQITSVRLTPQLRQQLDYLSHSLHKGKNWIIVQALQEFIQRSNYSVFVKEAQRQSLLARVAEDQQQVWQDNTDISG